MLKLGAKILMKLKTTATIVGLDYVPPIPDPLSVEITSPLEGAEFEEGNDIVVSFSLNGDTTNISKVAVEVNGVEIDSHIEAPYGADFTLTNLTTGAKEISIIAYEDGIETANDTVNISIVEVFAVDITMPTENEEFRIDEQPLVMYSFNRENENITKVELVVNGTIEEEITEAPFDLALQVDTHVLGENTIEIKVYEGVDLIAQDSVDIIVVRVPLELTITAPTELQEFTEGDDIEVNYSFDRLAPEVTKTELWINGVLIETDNTAPFDTFTLSDVTEGSKIIEVKAYDGVTEIAADSVNIVVEALPFFIEITEPTEDETFTEGDNVDVVYTFNRINENVTKKELWINGVLSETQMGSTAETFTIEGITEGEKELEVRVYSGEEVVANDTVNVIVESGFAFEQETIDYMTAIDIADNDNPSMYSGLTNNDVWNIVNDRFLAYKTNGLMTELQAEWWMLGNTATQHSYNALNPSAFQLEFFGGWVHSELGALGNGTNAYATTGFIPSINQLVNSNGLSIVVGTNNSSDVNRIAIGAFTGTSKASLIIVTGIFETRMNGDKVSTSNSDSRGIYTVSKQTSTITALFKNGVKQTSGNSGDSLTDLELYIGALNVADSPYTGSYIPERIQNAAAHTGLSDAQAAIYHSIVDDFENALGRKTW